MCPEDGLLWETRLNLSAIIQSFSSPVQTVDFLLRRSNSKQLCLTVLRKTISEQYPLSIIAAIFKRINVILQSSSSREESDWSSNSPSSQVKSESYSFLTENAEQSKLVNPSADVLRNLKRDSTLIINQSDMHKFVFHPLDNEEKVYFFILFFFIFVLFFYLFYFIF